MLKLRIGKPEFGEREGNVITHYGKGFKPVEIEFLDASVTASEILRVILSSKAKPQPLPLPE